MVETLAHDVLRTVTLLHVIDAPEQGPEAERYLAAWRTGGNARASRASVA